MQRGSVRFRNIPSRIGRTIVNLVKTVVAGERGVGLWFPRTRKLGGAGRRKKMIYNSG